ncbi:hypothetical protein AKJ56_02235 [candidate division MSBL1 archaeon SCGC-AAA382N08]|uniref:PD-(D/E)XK endonuclease-like domain-containing protein n=1 Tax=candidate division MSBL1 archaeon SCGC-AAA382N08 TaxID=1698285 RepID=A0A133VN57_9EURY|nr:hypothetical protein AKJ56_02235 [candidate division MSBL1 archaeon SCGC-AAA382N08]
MSLFGYKNEEEFKEKCGYEIEGSWFPRVTRIVSIKSKPALHYFYASINSYAEGERIKELSADEGTRIHEAAQDILVGKKPTIAKDIAPAIKAFREFIADRSIEVEPNSIERRVVNYKEKFAGTIDVLALINGRLGVMDIKTSKAIYRDYNLQAAAYMATLMEEIKDLETKWILRIDQHRVCQKCGAVLREKGGRKKISNGWPNDYRFRNCVHEWGPVEGKVELKEFPFWEMDYEGFLGAKKLWEWENQDWLKKIGYL